DPWADSEIYFGAGHLQDRITRRINSDFVQQRAVPKFFLFGRYGAGKTHTLAHIAHVLRTDTELARDFPTEPIYFELAPLRTREKWSTVHERLINAIGLLRLKDAVSALISNAGPQTDPLQALHEFEFAIRRLVGNENNVLGLILAYQTEGGAAPRVLQHDGIRRRVDYEQGFIDLTGLVLVPEDARQFILEVINYLVDGDAAK